MSHVQDTPISLTVIDQTLPLKVISFVGQEALNQPYRFDIDLISPLDDLDTSALIARSAFLCLGSGQGIHGVIGSARQLHAGRGVGHYRLRLEPRLQRLQQRRQRRIFQGLNAPQIIAQLLAEHGIGADDCRVEHRISCYRARPLCTQYDENDLHLLQRLCEEEGIHYRFEHQPGNHVLVFADDPASFPERPAAVGFRLNDGRAKAGPGISHMAEHFSLRPSYSSHYGAPVEGAEYSNARGSEQNLAANQVCEPAPRLDHQKVDAVRFKQSGERRLERLRCERRHVHGLSDEPTLVSGHIMRVTGHPDTLFNDQWLLTDIHHAGKQPHLLRGLEPADISAIMAQILAHERQPDTEILNLRRGYRNHFKVIPWAMPFRPSLKHPKPWVATDERATLIGDAQQRVMRDDQGRVRARLHTEDGTDVMLWLPMILQPDDAPLIPGTEVQLSYFDNDPDRPVICAVIGAAEGQAQSPQVWINGLPRVPAADDIHVGAGQTLQASAADTLTLTSPTSRIELSSTGIRIIGPQPASSVTPQVPPPQAPAAAQVDLNTLFRWLDPNRL